MVEDMIDVFQKDSDFQLKIKNEEELTENDMIGQDLCIAIGGDSTFLRATKDLRCAQHTPVIGINS